MTECCKKVALSSSGPAFLKQWDRMGTYSYTGQTLHGRYVYQHENFTQHIFYIFGEFDGWLLGPTPDLNFGGVKNSHDRMCVHTQDSIDTKAWGYYAGPRDTKVKRDNGRSVFFSLFQIQDPEEAYPHWKHDDSTLSLRCVAQTVTIDSRLRPDPERAPMLRKLYRR